MEDLNDCLYEIFFKNAEGVPLLYYIRANSKENAKELFSNKINENVDIFYILPTSTDIFED
jgi:hypothetical protein